MTRYVLTEFLLPNLRDYNKLILELNMLHHHEKLDYVEFPSRNLEGTKQFFTQAFGWSFEDYGADYTSFADQGLNGGFFKSDSSATTESGSALLVFYSKDLEGTLNKVTSMGGKIVRPIFSFPGGRRFHFTEPGGNEFGVWSD